MLLRHDQCFFFKSYNSFANFYACGSMKQIESKILLQQFFETYAAINK